MLKHKIMIKLISITFLVLLASAPQAEIYKWVDEQGRTQYGDKAIDKSEKIEVDTQKKGNIKSSKSREEKRQNLIDAFNEDRTRENENKAKLKKKRKKLERGCAVSKDQLRRYERAGYLYDLDKDGNRIVIDDEERKKDTESLRKRIKKYCK